MSRREYSVERRRARFQVFVQHVLVPLLAPVPFHFAARIKNKCTRFVRVRFENGRFHTFNKSGFVRSTLFRSGARRVGDVNSCTRETRERPVVCTGRVTRRPVFNESENKTTGLVLRSFDYDCSFSELSRKPPRKDKRARSTRREKRNPTCPGGIDGVTQVRVY